MINHEKAAPPLTGKAASKKYSNITSIQSHKDFKRKSPICGQYLLDSLARASEWMEILKKARAYEIIN